jgi:hypothetical protein
MATFEDSFWNSFSEAIGFVPREDFSLTGASGLSHRFFSVSVDEERKRLLTVSREMDPKISALVHNDVMLAHGDYNLMTVRPVTFDINHFAKLISEIVGAEEIDVTQIQQAMKSFSTRAQTLPELTGTTSDDLGEYFDQMIGLAGLAPPLVSAIRASALSGLGGSDQFVLLIRQLSALDFSQLFRRTPDDGSMFSLKPLLNFDTSAVDRASGLCPIPLYELSESDWEEFSSNAEPENIREKLGSLGVSQYFYPPADHNALALIDRGVRTLKGLAETAKVTEQLGHAIVEPEVVGGAQDVEAIVRRLQDRNLIVEGEMGLTVTEAGQELRATVKFRPREGVFSKVINRMNINIDTKGWFGVSK